MARTGQLQAGETLEQFAKRMGLTLRELYRLNPNLTANSIVEGLSLTVPDTAASAVSQAPAQAPAPTVSPTGEAAPTGELTGEAGGLFQEMLKDFTKAFQTFLSAPSFITGYPTARAGAEKGRAAPGFSQQEAAFLREIEPELYSRYGEAVQREFALTGKIPTLTAADFLKGIKVKEEMEMTAPGTVRGARRFGPPSITPRRLKF